MIENKEMAYCMAKLENEIRAERKSFIIYLDCKDGVEDDIYKRMVSRWSTMITAFELAFGVSYFRQY